LKVTIQESPAVAKEDALQPIQFLLQYWPSRSSKVDDFHFIYNGVYHFILVINSNFDLSLIVSEIRVWPVFHRKRTFFLLPPFNPEFESVPFALDRGNFACLC